jgi:cell wall-associated NlpC family hydrolase
MAGLPISAAAPAWADGAGAPGSGVGGYWLAGSTGTVTASGTTPFGGYAPPAAPAQPVVALAPTPDGGGYWEATAAGQVLPAGDAIYEGSAPASLRRPVVALAPTPDGGGYWLFAADGGVFCFGDASFYGSAGSLRLSRPVVGGAATADGHGYWLVTSGGGVFTFGDARYYGSAGGTRLAAPIVAMAATPGGTGYWLAGAAGQVLAYGDAGVRAAATPGTAQTGGASGPASGGTSGGVPSSGAVVGLAPTPDGQGYWLATSTGSVLAYGDAELPPTNSTPAGAEVVAVAAPGPPPAPGRAVQWALAQVGKPYLYGGTGPDGYDCSGLVMAAFDHVGVSLPRVAQDQYDAGPAVATGAPLEPGDVVFFGTAAAVTHDGIYVGNGEMVDAPHSGSEVRVESFTGWPDYLGATRPAG